MIFNGGVGKISKKGGAWQERSGEKIEGRMWFLRKKWGFKFNSCMQQRKGFLEAYAIVFGELGWECPIYPK